MANPDIITEPFSLFHLRSQARDMNAMTQANRDYIESSPGLAGRHKTTRESARSIVRMVMREDAQGELIKIEGKVVGAASFLVDKAVGIKDTHTVARGIHTWYWLGDEELAQDGGVQTSVADVVTRRGRQIAIDRADTARAAMIAGTGDSTIGITIGGSGVPPEDLPEIAPAPLFTTLEREHDPAAALLGVGFIRMGAPAVLETFPPDDRDGLVVPDLPMILAIDKARV